MSEAKNRFEPFSGRRIVLGVTGGIAAYKAVEVLRLLVKEGAQVRVIMTRNATEFVDPLTFHTLSGRPVLTELFPHPPLEPLEHLWAVQGRGDRERAPDLAIVAPATANFLGKYARGIADDFLTTALLAAPCPVLVAPAMNTWMLHHPAVQDNLKRLAERGVTLVEAESGALASPEEAEGPGRLAEPETIVEAVSALLVRSGDLAGKKVLVTAGPTRERWDAIRFLSNRSSGKMGYALALAARRRGAEVLLVSGPTSLNSPPGVNLVRVESAEEMRSRVMEALDGTAVVIKAAAVSDYRPLQTEEGKLKKTGGVRTLRLEPTPDILEAIGRKGGRGRRKGAPLLVGFAAESENLAANAKAKLQKKKLDLIVANWVGEREGSMGADISEAVLIDRTGREIETGRLTKRALAEVILDRVRELLAENEGRVKRLRGGVM
ncbi:MAG: bifunctional phosphopantothenoylcysteine decarboxylase/phosphopantothenate--cysteine ligase CoaBC [Nitrospinota bacterium]